MFKHFSILLASLTIGAIFSLATPAPPDTASLRCITCPPFISTCSLCPAGDDCIIIPQTCHNFDRFGIGQEVKSFPLQPTVPAHTYEKRTRCSALERTLVMTDWLGFYARCEREREEAALHTQPQLMTHESGMTECTSSSQLGVPAGRFPQLIPHADG
ncbi:hypothetical protein DFH09DRAFT_1279069 [Mycena vulgaris]|nr:hypothetical protein DFH09DRAFT_1279069 [Mycena vulgaris]